MQGQANSPGSNWKYALLAIALAGPLNGFAAEAEEIAMLRSQIAALQKRLDALQQTPAGTPSKTAGQQPIAAVDRRGLVVESADQRYSIRVRPRMQVDGRWFADEEDGSSGFELRRVRPVIQGKAGPLEWRVMPELAGTVRILDAWGDLHLNKRHFPLFLERALPSVLTPTRDIGIEWHGNAAGNVVHWTLGAYNGPFGFLSEYVRSSYDLERGGVSRTVDTDAFTVQASWVLTGEKASYGAIRPKKPFNPGHGEWGAFEIGLRYHQLEVGDEAFAGDATIRLSRGDATQKASACGIALNWYLTDNLLAGFNFEITGFSGLGARRPDEEVLISRFQVDF
jgi:hypothetical protein